MGKKQDANPENKYDEDFLEELQNQITDMTVLKCGEELKKLNTGLKTINLTRLEQLMFTYETLKEICTGEELEISYNAGKYFASMGDVTVSGKKIKFNDLDWLAKVSKFANNIEIYPQTNGHITMAFAFTGLAQK